MKLRYTADRPEHEEIEMISRTGALLRFPYDAMDPRPSASDTIRAIYVDPEMASEGVTYFLTSGAEGAVLVDHVAALRAERQKHGRKHQRAAHDSGSRGPKHGRRNHPG